MSKRKETGSFPVKDLEMKDTVSFNAAVQHNPKESKTHGDVEFRQGAHQKGPSGKRGGDQQERKRK